MGNFSVPSLLFVSLFVGYLRHHNYPLIATESILAFTAIIFLGLVLGYVLSISKDLKNRATLLFLVILLGIDLQLEPQYKYLQFHNLTNELPLVIVIFTITILFFLLLLFFLMLRQHLNNILVVSLATFLFGAVILPVSTMEAGTRSTTPSATSSVNSNVKGTVLHLILDGQIGAQGIPVNIQGGEEVKQRVRHFHEKWGFHLYGRAYSQYLKTHDSIPGMFNNVENVVSSELLAPGIGTGHRFRLAKNRYFQKHNEAGRAIHVTQSDYLDFCATRSTKIASCYTYPATSFKAMEEVALPARLKSKLILETFFRRSIIVMFIKELFGGLFNSPSSNDLPVKFYSLAVPSVIEKLTDQTIENPNGSLVFAHLLMPHAPFAWDKECIVRENAFTTQENTMHEFGYTKEQRVARYQNYFNQMHCVYNSLDNMFKKLSEWGLMDKLTIVIHGDHGSRIGTVSPTINNIDSLTSGDLIDAFSTHFAVKSSAAEQFYSDEKIPISQAFSKYFFKDENSLYDGEIRLRFEEGIVMPDDVKKMTMPDF